MTGITIFFTIHPSYIVVPIDKKINDWLSPATDFISDIVFYAVPFSKEVSIPFILIWLLGAGLFFTFYLCFINITAFRHAVNVTRGLYDKPKEKGEVSHFQALSAALSGTLGLGNIAGVAIAVSIGGPGATFWMIMAGLIGMCSKFAECTLGVKYRSINTNGEVSGGPMYYLSKGFASKGFPRIGKFFALFFAIMCIGGSLGGGNMLQSNQATQQIILAFGTPFMEDNLWLTGVIIAFLVAIVIIGGIKKIAMVAEFLVPFMCGLYILACLVILGYHYHSLYNAFSTIITEAFTGNAVKGGFIGVMLHGFQRASFSNEAGIGSASIAHSAVKTNTPVSEGMVGLLEPFIDTVVVCTMTALVIVVTGLYNSDSLDGIAITSRAFESVFSWFPKVLAIAVFLFAYATLLTWSYYGAKAWAYIFGNSSFARYSFSLLFCLFIVIGASMKLQNVIVFSDAMIFAMSFPNIIGLYLLAPEVKKDLREYLRTINKKNTVLSERSYKENKTF